VRHGAGVPGDGGSWLGYCIFQSEPCSATAATWALAFATFGAFAAGITAAIFAAGVYALEVKPRLGQDICADPAHSGCDRVQIVNELHATVYEKPTNFEELRFWKNRYEFTNLGRLPLVGVTLAGSATFSRDQSVFKLNVDLGNIPIHTSVHLETYFSKKLGQPTITWDKGSAKQSDGKRIAFHPVPTPDKGRTEVAYGLEIDETSEIASLRADLANLKKIVAQQIPAPKGLPEA
jgi:hypothetical protein